MEQKQFSSIAPRGTIRRFATAGGFNTFLFWLLWEILRLTSAVSLFSETGVWAIAWFISCTIAHFVHRFFTFDGRKDVKDTMLGALIVYTIGGALSTISYQILYSSLDIEIRLIFFINIAIWGLFTWASMRWFVFGYTEE